MDSGSCLFLVHILLIVWLLTFLFVNNSIWLGHISLSTKQHAAKVCGGFLAISKLKHLFASWWVVVAASVENGSRARSGWRSKNHGATTTATYNMQHTPSKYSSMGHKTPAAKQPRPNRTSVYAPFPSAKFTGNRLTSWHWHVPARCKNSSYINILSITLQQPKPILSPGACKSKSCHSPRCLWMPLRMHHDHASPHGGARARLTRDRPAGGWF